MKMQSAYSDIYSAILSRTRAVPLAAHLSAASVATQEHMTATASDSNTIAALSAAKAPKGEAAKANTIASSGSNTIPRHAQGGDLKGDTIGLGDSFLAAVLGREA